MAPNFLALATTLENLGARWLLAKRVNFVPCRFNEGQTLKTEIILMLRGVSQVVTFWAQDLKSSDVVL